MEKRKYTFVVGLLLCRIPPFPMRRMMRGNLDVYNYLKVAILNFTRFRLRIRYLSGSYIWLTDDWSYNYFHWTFDALMKLRSVQPNDDRPILVPEAFLNSNPFIGQSLEYLGFRVVAAKVQTTYVLREVWVTPMPLYFSRDAALNLRKRVTEGRLQLTTPMPKRLFISRKFASRRGLVNEFELAKALKRFGFSACFPELMTWEEQVGLFRSAEAIVGMHGAGLTNMLYAVDARIVVELRPRNHKNNLFLVLAEQLRIPYHLLLLESEISDFHGPSFVVDAKAMAELEKKLQSYLTISEESVS